MRKENTMDSTEAPPLCGCCRRVPVSHLALDVSEPLVGWEAFFEEKGILILADAAGRPSVARHVLADLLDEQRERQTRLLEEAAEKAAALVQPVAVGIPAVDEGATAYETLMSAGATSPQEEFGAIPPPRFLQEAIEEGSRHQAAEREAISRRKEAR